ncbi:MAG: LacI family DNA-binding transcriptional regulator [Oscillospiraceae bacterium]|nr:LacI family DNA-binding transcriptional regulator [Oscillospiraceae bacterium]
MVYIKDIAKACKVSTATVSKALNDQPDISESTKEYIKTVAAEMGYMSNSAARALKTGRSNNIGVLFDDDQNRGLSHEFFSTLLESIKSEAEKNGYDVTFISSGRKMSYLQHCMYRGFDGVIIANTEFDSPRAQELMESDFPVVTVDYESDHIVSVMSDNETGGRVIMRHVCDMGHRNIGVILGDLTDVTRKRLRGMLGVCEELGLEIPPCNIKEARFHDSSLTYFATQELLRLSDRPTCIIFQDDYSYIGGLNAIHDAGLSIPEDISTVGYDGIGLSRIISPRLVTYYQDTVTMGKRAVELLISKIEGNKPEKTAYEVRGHLLDGGSVRRITAAEEHR